MLRVNMRYNNSRIQWSYGPESTPPGAASVARAVRASAITVAAGEIPVAANPLARNSTAVKHSAVLFTRRAAELTGSVRLRE